MSNNNYEDYSYEDGDYDKKKSSRKKILILVFLVVAIILIIFLIRGCSSKKTVKKEPEFSYESTLLEAGKLYFENNSELYPSVAGECAQVDLQALIDKGLVVPNNFQNCNNSTSYVSVCILEDGTKQWTPWLVCTDHNSDSLYDESKEGTKAQIKADETYVDFLFMPQTLKEESTNLGEVEEIWKDEIKYDAYKTLATTTYYRYKDLTYIWNITIKKYYSSSGEKDKANDVKEYYRVSPNNDYSGHDNKTTEAYKWFTTTASKTYALNSNGAKAFSATAISGYPYSDGARTGYLYRTRTITSTYQPTLYYLCALSSSSTSGKLKTEACGLGEDSEDASLTYQMRTLYSCVASGSTSSSILASEVSKGTLCKTYSDWSKNTTTSCGNASDVCEITSVTLYNWYKLEGTDTKIYYPSNTTDVSKEIVYYTSAPIDGAQKDTSTQTTAYKWYKSSIGQSSSYSAVSPEDGATKTSDSKWTSWSSWSTSNPKTTDGRTRTIESKVKIKLQQIKGTTDASWENLSTEYMTKDAMIALLKEKGYNVEKLLDISNNGSIKYIIKMMIRNKKEAVK